MEKGYLNDMNDCQVKKSKTKRNWWEPKQKEKTKVEYYPSPGAFSFKYKNKTMWAFLSTGKTQLVGWQQKPQTDETIIICCYGVDVKIIQELIDEAVINSMEQDKGLLGIY